jgi:hypothetical protein
VLWHVRIILAKLMERRSFELRKVKRTRLMNQAAV